MKIDIPDEWLKLIWNVHPDTSIEDTVKIYFRDRNYYTDRQIVFLIGERALHEIGNHEKS